MTIGKKIKKQRAKLKMSQADLVIATGYPQPTLANYENDKRTPGTEEIIKIAKILNVTPAWLQFGSDEEFSNVSPADLITKKVLGSVSAGNLKELIDNDPSDDLETVYLPRKYLDDSKYFVLKIDGDSMTSGNGKHSFNDGDFMVYDKHCSPSSGDYVLIYNEQEKSSVFKKLVKDGTIHYLEPLNDKYPVREIEEEETIIGVAVYHQPNGNFLK